MTTTQDLGWLLANFADRVPGVAHAMRNRSHSPPNIPHIQFSLPASLGWPHAWREASGRLPKGTLHAPGAAGSALAGGNDAFVDD